MKIPIPFLPKAILIRVEPDVRKPRRPRFSIGRLMVAIALLAIVFAIDARRRAVQQQQLLAHQAMQGLLEAVRDQAIRNHKPIAVPESSYTIPIN